MFCSAIAVKKVLIMNSIKFEQSSDHKDLAIEWDIKNFMNHSLDPCRKTEVRDDGVRTNNKIIDYKVEDCTDVEAISSIFGNRLDQNEVRMSDIHFTVLSCKMK